MKYYYTDSLKAAWMQREFGIVFEPWIFDKQMKMPDGKIHQYKESEGK